MPVEWEWKDDDGKWVPFAPKDSAMIESHRIKGEAAFATTDLSFNVTLKK